VLRDKKTVSKILVVTPFNSQWIQELNYSFKEIAEPSFLSLDLPPLTQEILREENFVSCASVAYERLLLELAKTGAHEIYISYEFAWPYFETDFFRDLGKNIRIVGMLWDDSTFHERNYRIANHIGIETFTTGCPISVLRLREKGCSATFMQVYGARATYDVTDLSSKHNLAAFFGDIRKADRQSMLKPFQKIDGFAIFGGLSDPMSLQDMIAKIKDTKIIVNFSKSFVDENQRTVYQYKARILESIFCGSLPLTEYCPATEILLDGVVPQFRESEEGVEKLNFFANNDRELQKTVEKLLLIADKYRPDQSLRRVFLTHRDM